MKEITFCFLSIMFFSCSEKGTVRNGKDIIIRNVVLYMPSNFSIEYYGLDSVEGIITDNKKTDIEFICGYAVSETLLLGTNIEYIDTLGNYALAISSTNLNDTFNMGFFVWDTMPGPEFLKLNLQHNSILFFANSINHKQKDKLFHVFKNATIR